MELDERLVEALQAEHPDLDVHAFAADIKNSKSVRNPNATLVYRVKQAAARRAEFNAACASMGAEARDHWTRFLVSLFAEVATEHLTPRQVAARLESAADRGLPQIFTRTITRLRELGSDWEGAQAVNRRGEGDVAA